MTSSNLTRWFEGYKQQLFEAKFIDDIPDDIFQVIEIDPRKAARMLNADETHQKLSNEGESRGPRANVYVNKELCRAGKRKVTYQKHATFLAWLTYAGQAGSPHMMLATDAQGAKKGSHNGAYPRENPTNKGPRVPDVGGGCDMVRRRALPRSRPA